ncbi:hypothetical protein A8C56_22215 [Niabella ginsenosidivorans]|uniref:Polymerase nucleotidyl transferase domain-containing protein n=1 Tax=Niabella ginsenosidivorans TaxID=1176587 RepID=A0A1A9I7M8_9BACT|nr:nucleotidyltransferase domain-containing protein [Niabella ginsenosidivorans]ANH83335.1 hypothetical protein A8C56_22215 [Niabella ginsenosidivorans]
MQSDSKIFFQIIRAVQQLIPDAEVHLFGSRLNHTATDESDWDILILLNEKPSKQLKQKIHDAVFPISIAANAFINTLIASKNDWNNNPSYYSIHQSIRNNDLSVAK